MSEKRNYKDDERYRQWRYAVRARDNRMCQWPGCGSRKKIQVHHIYRWVDAPLLRYEIKNGICLCRAHHRMINGKEHIYAATLMGIVNGKQI